MPTRLKAATPRQEAAKKRARHSQSGRFVKQGGNGNGRSPQYSVPLGVSTELTRILRPQAAFRWILPNVAAITPQYIEMVMRGALAGNHVQQWELFDLMMDTWPELSACYQELCYGVLSKKIIFEPFHEEDEAPDQEAIDRMKLVSTALRGMQPESDKDENELSGTIKDLLDGWLRGVTVQEIIWQSSEDDKLGQFIGPKATFWVHPVCYGFNADGLLGLRTVSDQSPGGISPGRNNAPPQPYPYSYLSAQPQPAVLQPFPDHKFLIGIHKAKSGTALGGPLLRPLCWWWVAANFSADWLLNLAQLFGIPFRYATYDPHAPDQTINALMTMLQNMGSNGWAAFPAGTNLEFKETGGGRQAEYSPQGTLMDRADRYARLIVLGQTMTGNTMSSGKGGQAFGVVEKDVKQERIDAAGKYACDVINKQLIESILLLNYGDASCPPSIRMLEENEGQYIDAQRDQILKSIGVPLGVDFMRKKYGIPEPADDEEVLTQTTPQPPGTQTPELELRPDGLPRAPQTPGMLDAQKPVASANSPIKSGAIGIRESAAIARKHSIPSTGEYLSNLQHVKTDEKGVYDIVHKGERIGVTHEGFTRTGGRGWVNTHKSETGLPPITGTHKNLSDALRSTAHHLRQKDINEAADADATSQARQTIGDGHWVTIGGNRVFISSKFPSITYSAENERRVLRNAGVKTKEGGTGNIYIVRHGSTSLNSENDGKSPDIIRGHQDVPLTNKGRKQAREVADQLSDKGIKTIFTSDLSRASDTAQILADKLPENPRVIDLKGLRPWALGKQIEGKRTADVLDKIKYYVDNPDEQPDGGETFNNFSLRFNKTMKHIKDDHGHDDNVAVVTHYRGIKMLQATGGGDEPFDGDEFLRHDESVPPGSVFKLNEGDTK